MKTLIVLLTLGLSCLAHAGAGPETVMTLPEDYARQREIQTRQWQAGDELTLLRSVMSAMQDLEFVVDDTEPPLGLAYGTKYVSGRRLQLVVMVRPMGAEQYSVRACAYFYGELVEDPEAYQDFFDALGYGAAIRTEALSR